MWLQTNLEGSMKSDHSEITQILHRLSLGDSTAEERLIALVYGELRRLASYYMKAERSNHTLQPTALVHEAYVRLTKLHSIQWQDRAHFFATASNIMRRILVDYARSSLTQKRAARREAIPIEELLISCVGRSSDFIALDDAMTELAKLDPRQCRVVELRFFGGLSEEEAALILGVSPRTVKRDWRIAKAWLYNKLKS
jgi:RNA polymerase sigma-70 factor (ECF subfamily)